MIDALQYKDSANAVLRIHQRHYKRLDDMSVKVKGCQFVTPYLNKYKPIYQDVKKLIEEL